MHTLRSTLAKETEKQPSSPRALVFKSNESERGRSGRLWTLDVDGDLDEESQSSDVHLVLLARLLRANLKHEDTEITQHIYDAIFREFRQAAGSGRSQSALLCLLQDKASDLINSSDPFLKKYASKLILLIKEHIQALKGSERKKELLKFDQIVNSQLQQEKPQRMKHLKQSDKMKYEQQIAMTSTKRATQRDSNSSKSNEKRESCDLKLSKLLAKQKTNGKTNNRNEDTNELQLNITDLVKPYHEESVSFSDILATTSVKQRVRGKGSPIVLPIKKQKMSGRTGENDDQADEGFIFHRPKKGKK